MKSDNIKVTSQTDTGDIVLVVKKKKFPWWILLLLLPLILLLPVKRDIMLQFLEDGSSIPVSDAPSQVNYPQITTFGSRLPISISRNTGPEGNIEIRDISEPLWYRLFGGTTDTLYASCGNSCASVANAAFWYKGLPSNRYQQITLSSHTISQTITVVDSKTGQPLPGANVDISINGSSQSVQADGNGQLHLTDIPQCASIQLTGRKEGYTQNSISGTAGQMGDEASRRLPLMPLEPPAPPEPEPTDITFLNTDGSNPLAGVSNEITKNGRPAGTITSDSKGNFVVKNLLPTDKLSITSSKTGYETNSTKIRNTTIAKLNTMASRTIPLKKKEEPKPQPPKQDDLKGKSGDLRFNLQWYCKADLDMIVKDPNGKMTYYDRTRTVTGNMKGELDIDANRDATNHPERASTSPQENINYVNPKDGKYTVAIKCCPFHPRMNLKSRKIDFTLTIIDRNGRIDKRGSIGENDSLIFTVHTLQP